MEACAELDQEQRSVVEVGVEGSDNPSRDSVDPQGNHKELGLLH